MGVTINNPRREGYEIHVAARNANGDYSTPISVSIEHPGITKLDLSPQDVKGLISSVQIKLPTAYSKTSQTVYPLDTTSEAKNILGYKLYVMEIDPDTEEELWAEEEVIDYEYKGTDLNPSVYYQAETGKKFKFRVGVYDSVYHPEYNPVLYKSTISDYQIGETFKIEQPDISDALIQPNDLTEELTTTEDIEEKITLKVGNHTTGVAGGIGLRYDDGSTYSDLGEGIDVQVVANRFRIFKEDFSEDGNALFAVGTVDDKDQIYMNADEIALVSKNPDLAGGEHDDNFFVLDNDGLRIWTPGLQLSKDGSAVFDGEVNATQFSVGNWSTDVSGDNLPESNAKPNEFTTWEAEAGNGAVILNDQGLIGTDGTDVSFKIDTSGDAYFSGSLDAATGTVFAGEFYGVDDRFQVDEDGVRFYIDADLTETAFELTSTGDATFGGELQAASGTFTGSLQAATGEFDYLEAIDGTIQIGSSQHYGQTRIRVLDSSNPDTHLNLYHAQMWMYQDGNPAVILASTGENDSGSVSVYHKDSNKAQVTMSGSDGRLTANEIVADTKDFRINHPDPNKSEYNLIHRSIESPTEGENIYRYQKDIKNEIVIDLPSYYKYLNRNSQVFVTPQGHFGSGYGEVNDNKLTVNVSKKGKYNILVIGTRKDEVAIKSWQGAEVLKE